MTNGRVVPGSLLALRIFVGGFFLYEASSQMRKGWIGGDGLRHMLEKSLGSQALLPPYRAFLENVVIEHDGLFTLLVIAGEIAVGVAILVGLATRLSAAVALTMNILFAMMNGLTTAGGFFDELFVVLELALIVLAARQLWSADSWLRRRGFAGPWLSGTLGPPRANG